MTRIGAWLKLGCLTALFAAGACAKSKDYDALAENGGASVSEARPSTGGFRATVAGTSTGGLGNTGGTPGVSAGTASIVSEGGTDNGGSEAVEGGAENGGSAVAGGAGGVAPGGGSSGAYSTGAVTLTYVDRTNGDASQALSFVLTLTNEGDAPIDLATVTIRYWFTDETGEDLVAEFDYVSGAFQSGSNVSVDFGEAAYEGATTYAEFSFDDGWLVGDSTATDELQIRIHTSGYQGGSFDQGDDYSFGNADRIAVYIDGALVWGVPPEGTPQTGAGGAGGAGGGTAGDAGGIAASGAGGVTAGGAGGMTPGGAGGVTAGGAGTAGETGGGAAGAAGSPTAGGMQGGGAAGAAGSAGSSSPAAGTGGAAGNGGIGGG